MVLKPGSKRVVRWAVYDLPSAYSQKMKRLGCKIFGEYYTPPVPVDAVKSNYLHLQREVMRVHAQSEAVILRQSKLPDDLNPSWNLKYYPPHPQIRSLMYTLRQFGLYRDEHMDFVDEMKRLRILRGKRYRVLGGMTGKRSQLRDGAK